jgi:hypothetical protein
LSVVDSALFSLDRKALPDLGGTGGAEFGGKLVEGTSGAETLLGGGTEIFLSAFDRKVLLVAGGDS